MLKWLDRQPLKTHYAIVATLCLVALCFVNPFHKILELRYISWDSAGYYIYLPTFLIYNDPREMKFLADIMSRYDVSSYMYQAIKVDNGHYTMSYTMGVALLQLPAFLVAHACAHLFGFPTDGYSLPYQWGVFIIGALYALVGACLLLKFLSNCFSKSAALITVVVIVLGTNLYNYGFAENSMTHGYLFFLVSALLLLTDKFYSRPTYGIALLLGLVCGMIVLIRPTVVLVFIIPVLWNVTSWNALVANVRHWLLHWKKLLATCAILVLPFGLQMLYWQHTVGQPLFSSYAYTNQHFYFTEPQLRKGLLNWGKGWLILTPIVWLMLLGFCSVRSPMRKLYPVILFYLVVNVWVVFSWHAWEYGGGFSARALVETYALLAVPFTGMVDWLKSKRMTVVIAVPVALLVALNLFQTWQYQHDVYPTGPGHPYEFKAFFGKTKRDLLPGRMIAGNGLVQIKYIDDTRVLVDSVYANHPDRGLVCSRSIREFVAVKDGPFETFDAKPNQRFRFTTVARYLERDAIAGAGARMCISFERENYGILYQVYKRIDGDAYRRLDTTVVEAQIPCDLRLTDVCKLFVWNAHDSRLLIQSQRVEVLNVKD